MYQTTALTTSSESALSAWVLPLVGLVAVVLVIVAILYFIFVYLKKHRIQSVKDWVMLQVSVPRDVKKPEEQVKEDWRELMSVAEQLFSSFSSTYKRSISNFILGQPRFSFEIVSNKGEIYFYIGTPKEFKSFVEKQVLSYYPHAQITEEKNFKIFAADRKFSFASLKLARKYIYPIKTYKNLESDPLNSLTNTMAKLQENEAAAVQILIRPSSGLWRDACSRAAHNVAEGKGIYDSAFSEAIYVILDSIGSAFRSKDKNGMDRRREEETARLTPAQEEMMKALREKGSKVGFETQIRIVVTGTDEQSIKMNRDNIVNSFSQYKAPEWNGLAKLNVIKRETFITRFILREFSRAYSILNTEELASIFHLPNKFTETPNIHWIKARLLPPPPDLPREGTLIGESHYRGEIKKVYITNDDRRKHIFMIGKTGTGKTTLYLTMIKQDIEKGRGCCFIDPNGDAAEMILRYIPKERADDVIYFDPSYGERPMGLNLLEWKRPEDRDFLIAEWLEIFYKLFDPNRTGMVGPQFEHWGRNAALTIMAQPGGGSLIEIPRLFTDDEFRETCIGHLKDPVVLAFWQQQMAKTADFHKSEMFNYFISKFGRFMTNDLMRNIIGQTKSAFDIREVMDKGKILIINLSKGKLGEMNSYLLGMIIVSKIQVAAFQRADMPEEERKDFYLYVDEFQNFTTDSFKTILSEARKYRLNLAVANQYIQQLTEPIRDACIGNAGTLLCYRVGATDAEFMVKEFPGVSEQDIINLPFANLYIKLLISGTPSKPFSMKGVKSEPTQKEELAKSIRELSRMKYGKDKSQVEEDIKKRTLSQTGAAPEPGPPREANV